MLGTALFPGLGEDLTSVEIVFVFYAIYCFGSTNTLSIVLVEERVLIIPLILVGKEVLVGLKLSAIPI